MEKKDNTSVLRQYLSPVGAWALSFGCAVGWGAFVMPGTTFLPLAGPWGTFIGMAVGGLVMFIIGINYHYLMNRYPDCGGTFAYTKKEMGYDHGFLSTWFLMLVYIAIIWANATAIPLITRTLAGDAFQFGFHYTFAGFDVYMGETLLSVGAIVIAACVCIYGGRCVGWIMTAMAAVLIGGILICAAGVFAVGGVSLSELTPAYLPDKDAAAQIFRIIVLAPWAFVGFESIAHSAEEFKFPVRRSITVMAVSLVTGTAAYGLLALLAAAAVPDGYAGWMEYIADIGNLDGLAGMPAMNTVNSVMGHSGVIVLGFAAACGIMTGLIGNMIAVSRLIYALARDNMLPRSFTVLNRNSVPAHVIALVAVLSLPVPLLGRSAIGWVVDVNTIGATIAYAYTSAVAFRAAAKDKQTLVQLTGAAGFLISVAFTLYFLVPSIWAVSVLSPESYMILILWSILGFFFFRYVFWQDDERRFGRSTIVWIALLFLTFFVTMLWFREQTQRTTAQVLQNLDEYNVTEMAHHGVTLNETEKADAEQYLSEQIRTVDASMQNNGMIQLIIILTSLFIMFSIYNAMKSHESAMEIEKAAAEQSNRAKSVFLSNMSHDIRTPMNAIVGYTELAKDISDMPAEGVDYLDKIEASSHHLLALINDILDMSRIESGKTELDVQRADLLQVFEDMKSIFHTQMDMKKLTYTVDTDGIVHRYVMCDANRLNRVLLNLISNAYKFTPEGGAVSVRVRETGSETDKASFAISVKDTGMGMSPEFAAQVFEAYSRERTAKNIQGTGLGMAITKSIVDLMGGTIGVATEQGRGTEFTIHVDFAVAKAPETKKEKNGLAAAKEMDYRNIRLLLVEDQVVNREIATRILKKFGFQLECAEDGKAAVNKVAASSPGYYSAVLMDIQMPVMNGYEAARAIRALEDPALSGVPIIAMTANAFAEDVQMAMDAGMNGHIAKPISIDKMIETLSEIL